MMRHFFRCWAVLFVLSSSVCMVLANQNSSSKGMNVPADTLRNSLMQLNWAENEVRGIADIFSGESFLREQASEQSFKSVAPDAGIIHLATHAIVNDESPMYSRLIFSNVPDPVEDGALNTYELYNMNLKANLAVLSACNTGTGKHIRGEGIMSLARGFMYAGCPNVLMSLWPVDDKSTSQVMTYFYQALSDGRRKDEALHNAKVTYIRQAVDVKKSPFYWAPFILIGDATPLPQKSPLMPILSIILLLSVVFGVIFLSRRRHLATALKFPGMISLLLFTVFLIVIFQPKPEIHSQPQTVLSDTSLARSHLELAEKLLDDAKYDSSIILLESARPVFEAEKMWDAYITSLNFLGKNYRKKSQLQTALDYANNAIEVGNRELGGSHPQIAESYKIIANVHYMMKKYADAQRFYERALALLVQLTGEKNATVASLYNNIGNVFFVQGKLDDAQKYYQKSLDIRIALLGQDNPSLSTAYSNIANIYWKQHRFDSAIDYYNNALAIMLKNKPANHPDFINIYNNLGGLYCTKGDYETGMYWFGKALNIQLSALGEEHPAVLQALLNMGLLYYEKGDYEQALNYYSKIKSTSQDKRIQAYLDDLSCNLGMVYSDKGDYDKALTHFENYIRTSRVRFGEIHPNMAIGYNNLGQVYEITGEYDQALEYFKRATDIYKKINNEAHPENYQNIAKIYLAKGEFQKALDIYESLLDKDEKLFGKTDPRIRKNLFYLGEAYFLMADYERAFEYYQQSLKFEIAVFGEKHRTVALIYQKIGDVYQKLSQLAEALQSYQRSLEAYVPDFDSGNSVNPELAQLVDDPDLLATLTSKAEVLQKMGEKNPDDPALLRQACETYELAINYIDKLRNSYQSEKSKLYMGEHGHAVYREAVPAMLTLFEQSNTTLCQEKAFMFAEKNKGYVLHQALMESKAKSFANIPDSLLEQEKNLKLSISFYDKNLFEEQNKGAQADSAKIAFWHEKLFQLKQDYENLILRFENEFPGYYNLKYQNAVTSVRTIQDELLDENDALVEYFIGDGVLYIFTITKTDFKYAQVEINSAFENQINNLRDAIVKFDYAAYTKNAWALYQTLVQPVESIVGGKNLIIIPDGILGYLPFETLLTEQADSDARDYANLSYLLFKHQITYNYSATLLLENLSRKNTGFENEYVGFAPVVFK